MGSESAEDLAELVFQRAEIRFLLSVRRICPQLQIDLVFLRLQRFGHLLFGLHLLQIEIELGTFLRDASQLPPNVVDLGHVESLLDGRVV